MAETDPNTLHDIACDIDGAKDVWHVCEDRVPFTIADGNGLRVALAYTIEAAEQIVADHNG